MWRLCVVVKQFTFSQINTLKWRDPFRFDASVFRLATNGPSSPLPSWWFSVFPEKGSCLCKIKNLYLSPPTHWYMTYDSFLSNSTCESYPLKTTRDPQRHLCRIGHGESWDFGTYGSTLGRIPRDTAGVEMKVPQVGRCSHPDSGNREGRHGPRRVGVSDESTRRNVTTTHPRWGRFVISTTGRLLLRERHKKVPSFSNTLNV